MRQEWNKKEHDLKGRSDCTTIPTERKVGRGDYALHPLCPNRALSTPALVDPTDEGRRLC